MAQLSKEDAKSAFDTSDVEIEDIGPSGEEKFKEDHTMSMPERRKRAAHAAYTMHNVPKKWKGRGDYFFEVVAPGKLRITGGDKAKSLTGGKSVVITDRSKISEIFEKAREGDIVEEGVSYEADLGEAEVQKPLEKTRIPGAGHTVESYGEGLEEKLQEVSSPEDVGVPRLEQPEEPPGTADLGATSEGLRPGRVHRNPHQEALEFIKAQRDAAAESGNRELANQYDAAYDILFGSTEA